MLPAFQVRLPQIFCGKANAWFHGKSIRYFGIKGPSAEIVGHDIICTRDVWHIQLYSCLGGWCARISAKKHNSFVVVNMRLLEASAPELSLNDFKQIGIRKPELSDAISHSSPIWPKVSKTEIFFCVFESSSNGKKLKSEWWNRSENHKNHPEGWTMNPPSWHDTPAAQASGAAWPGQMSLGVKGLVGMQQSRPITWIDAEVSGGNGVQVLMEIMNPNSLRGNNCVT